MNLLKLDGRYVVFFHHLSLLILAKSLFRLQRTWTQIFSAFVFAIIIELIFYQFSNKYKNSNRYDRSLSAVSEASGLLVLINSTYWWFYGLMVGIAIASKYLITNKNGHVFNPINFAIIFSLAALPLTSFNFFPDSYSVRYYPIFHVFVLGCYATYLAKRWSVSAGFFITSMFVSIILSNFNLMNFIYLMGPDYGAVGLIFIFLMITDPKTTPASRKYQFLFGGAVALGHHMLKQAEVLYTYFLSLFIIIILKEIYCIIHLHYTTKKSLK
jgi:hypothetical protein